MAGKRNKGKRPYRHPLGLVGYKEPVRDGFNLSELDRALTKWLRENDPNFHTNPVPCTYIEYPY